MDSDHISIWRHRRLMAFAFTAVTLALIGHFFFDFGKEQTFAYAVTAYVLLNALNYRSVLTRMAEKPERSLDN